MKLYSVTHDGRRLVNHSLDDLREAGVDEATLDALVDADIIASAHAEIDAICDRVYTASPSRNARYTNKYDEALRYKVAGYPASVSEAEYPTLVNEAPKRSLTKRQLADVIIARRDAFHALGGKAEAARADIEAQVTAAAGEADKRAVAAAIVSAFAALAAA